MSYCNERQATLYTQNFNCQSDCTKIKYTPTAYPTPCKWRPQSNPAGDRCVYDTLSVCMWHQVDDHLNPLKDRAVNWLHFAIYAGLTYTLNFWHSGTLALRAEQGRRHGFESGGQILRAKPAENCIDPPLFGQWGTKYCLDIAKSA